MINFIKEVFATYIKTEKQLIQIRCLVVDNGQEIRKVIRTFPRKTRNQAMEFAYNLAFWGYSLDEIINRLNEWKIVLLSGLSREDTDEGGSEVEPETEEIEEGEVEAETEEAETEDTE